MTQYWDTCEWWSINVCHSPTLIPYASLDRIKRSSEGHKSSNWIRKTWQVLATNRKQSKNMCMLLFFSRQSGFERYTAKTYVWREARIYSWGKSFPLERSMMGSFSFPLRFDIWDNLLPLLLLPLRTYCTCGSVFGFRHFNWCRSSFEVRRLPKQGL